MMKFGPKEEEQRTLHSRFKLPMIGDIVSTEKQPTLCHCNNKYNLFASNFNQLSLCFSPRVYYEEMFYDQ